MVVAYGRIESCMMQSHLHIYHTLHTTRLGIQFLSQLASHLHDLQYRILFSFLFIFIYFVFGKKKIHKVIRALTF